MSGSSYDISKYALCLGSIENAKASAIYFDYILPIMYGECPNEVITPSVNYDEKLMQAITHIQLGALQYVPNITKFGSIPLNSGMVEVIGKEENKLYRPNHLELDTDQRDIADKQIIATYLDEESQFRKALSHFINSYLGKIPIVIPDASLNNKEATMDDLSILLIGLPLIDTSKASWKQIIEIRKDDDAKAKLRRLRLFMHDNWLGKEKSYIEDTINVMIYEYSNTAKDFGFELLHGAVSELLNSKSLLLSGISTLTAILMGQPVTAGIASIIGTSIEVGKITLKISEKKHAFNKLSNNHKLAYIFKVQDKVG